MVWLLGTHGVCLTCIGTFLALPSKSNVVNCGHSNSGVTSGHLCQSEWVLLWQTVGIVPEPCRPEPPLTCSVFWMGLQAPPSLLFPDLWKRDGVNHSSWGGRKDGWQTHSPGPGMDSAPPKCKRSFLLLIFSC